jgi:hypothetical protein
MRKIQSGTANAVAATKNQWIAGFSAQPYPASIGIGPLQR